MMRQADVDFKQVLHALNDGITIINTTDWAIDFINQTARSLLGIADDDLMSGVKLLMDKGININEVYTPFPVHGLDKALKLRKTRISDAAFIYAVYGVTI